jgi:hypothetical protein
MGGRGCVVAGAQRLAGERWQQWLVVAGLVWPCPAGPAGGAGEGVAVGLVVQAGYVVVVELVVAGGRVRGVHGALLR